MQRTLAKLVVWANRWEMGFNVNKCRVMHIGKRNLEVKYQIESVDEERALGVLINKDLKFSKNIYWKKNKAN